LAGALEVGWPPVEFAKYHALGNDYLVMDPTALAPGQVNALARRICDRHRGLGSDGILLGPLPTAEADFGLRIINPDGSEAEKSGNGLRIFARFLFDTGRVGGEAFRISTPGGVALSRVFPERGLVRVGMGRASFDSEVIGIAGPRREVIGEVMTMAGRRLVCTGVSVGNPHCVVEGVEVSELEARSLGPQIETEPRFLNRTNVQLLSVLDRTNLRIEIWERGAGYTLASGSSASAAAAAARRLGHCDERVAVHMPGGVLDVEIAADYGVTQTGPATRVASGVLSPEILADGVPWSRTH
jgi:diaminopimelate epimerase